ncbi:probable myosin light chain kinase DDB_G0279831 [Daphnia pulicaria]|jgi:uncharacterized C2H2 Zn-finger protein|uniref:probable myosin light chain kinase DDB_G0279831 n=1 Tax=Daphnia pulicaria TaxID=35523 RepID=UPI001EEC6D49|nr:probable myosin light chain kinase DDB_G0279831 [Daphnia pulicaria]XP_046631544.1 probable myosin light chain kinase DDB_G0279831 [Daphnia pulicaria]XP_046631545.1 probable myosin light chain kinase DDB_G0279831 [Daphnia pulicaria]XP_046631546.1 probable myosin light chain kinase DDB_G0279831 [Daphnia pulicaria]XP_046631547.1 probable myosin light chain kinase DDB_G0279831 [Daphnia pulicaria]XP_046631549.1 probable myosin light chain kinase DDB_G0279831 [Daphnia pulicaria]XP_046631550.1 pr
MTMDTTMESGRESNSIPKNQTTPKRSFDVAFLTGVSESHRYHNNNQVSSDEDDQEEDLRCAAKKSIEDKPTIHSKLQQQQQTSVVSGSPKSAFKKVSKINHNNNNNTAETSASSSSAGGTGNNLPVDLSMMMSAAAAAASSAPPYYHPFSFPAIATTLSLQLLQQNNAAKGLAMSLFSHPAAAAAAAAMAAHQQSFFQQQQQQQQHPPMKSGGGGGGNNLLHPSRATDRRPDGANNLIEDYLRAQASLYQHQSEKDFNLFPANNKTMRHADSSAATYCPPTFHSAMDHRLSRPNSSSMAPPPPPPPPPAAPTPTTPQSQQQSVSSSPIHQIPAAALAASLASAPSQNVCAKCNLSFRMTSDLVYHMRSQHRRDANTDPVRQKRQEKLRCPVCGENFRERHHLTRHMTSHEDRELETK